MRQQAHFAILRLRLMKSGRQLAAQRALRALFSEPATYRPQQNKNCEIFVTPPHHPSLLGEKQNRSPDGQAFGDRHIGVQKTVALFATAASTKQNLDKNREVPDNNRLARFF